MKKPQVMAVSLAAALLQNPLAALAAGVMNFDNARDSNIELLQAEGFTVLAAPQRGPGGGGGGGRPEHR